MATKTKEELAREEAAAEKEKAAADNRAANKEKGIGETVEGGDYVVDGRHVDADGKDLGKKK